MMVDQGMDLLKEFRIILTNDKVKSLCKVLCQPGDTTGNPPTPHPVFVVLI